MERKRGGRDGSCENRSEGGRNIKSKRGKRKGEGKGGGRANCWHSEYVVAMCSRFVEPGALCYRYLDGDMKNTADANKRW
eukprot:758989-Hanusia_phi.AAC.1